MTNFNVVPDIEEAISNRITQDGTVIGANFSAVLTNFEPDFGCTTTMERTCILTAVADKCETSDNQYFIVSHNNII